MADSFALEPDCDNYCVVGNPVAHSKSPLIHQAFASQTSQAIHYQAIQVETSRFDDFLRAFIQRGGKGLNVTLPFKGDACKAVDERSNRASVTGSVNTIKVSDSGRTSGDTTDGCGLVRDLVNHGMELNGCRLLILGAGGAVRGVIPDLFDAGVSAISICNRTASRAEQLVSQFTVYPGLCVLPADVSPDREFDLVINGTSASLNGELPVLPPDLDVSGCWCYDMAYAEQDTVFVEWAREKGASRALDGLGMLVEQAAESFYVWRGVRPDTKPVIDMLRK